MVLATQNPIEIAGTYPLPESQLDRFLLRIAMGYPNRKAELAVLDDQKTSHPIDAVEPVAQSQDIVGLQEAVREIKVAASVAEYIVDLAEATRKAPQILLGASPRASLALFRASQALAFIEGRDYVLPDDVKRLAVPVLAHRLIEKDAFEKGIRNRADRVVRDLLEKTPVPL
jgi:MoxR-like ATPase